MAQRRSPLSIVAGGAIPLWRDIRVLQAVGQIVSAIVVLGLLYFLFSNMMEAANARGLGLGYDFLEQSAGFDLGDALIPYDPSMTFSRALLVGLLNTLRVALVGVVLATVLGIVVGLSRLSSNWLVRNLANVYVETIRNVPLLVQLFFWFFAVFQQLPPVAESITLGPFAALNQRGINMVALRRGEGFTTWLAITAVAILLALALYLALSRYRLRTGRRTHSGLVALLVLLGLPLLGWFLVGGAPLTTDFPVLGRFNYTGGTTITTNFAALLVGLVIYTAAFIAEIVRAGIQAVSKGQREAARSLGLSGLQAMRLVVFPQALRVIVPPLISQYLNLTKNSSLAVAIGFPDLFAVGKTIIDQAGRAVPVFVLIMVTYLLISLTYSLILNLYNRRISFVER
ncbi:MAG: ABC transporter permease subunit [Chloroflexi bacterium]|nr:ABC transporter permease subunit [Chloroflexota bacterium]